MRLFACETHFKDKLISKCLFGFSNSPKKRTWKLKFLPQPIGQKFFVRFLGELKKKNIYNHKINIIYQCCKQWHHFSWLQSVSGSGYLYNQWWWRKCCNGQQHLQWWWLHILRTQLEGRWWDRPAKQFVSCVVLTTEGAGVAAVSILDKGH